MYKIVIFSLLAVNFAPTVLSEKCAKCHLIEDSIVKLIEESETKNFGGGNSAFESTKMGDYRTSEIRLIELTESLYNVADLASGIGNTVLQEMEDEIESWWLKVFRKNPTADYVKLKELLDFCIPRFCCPWNHWGPNCAECEPCFAEGGSCSGNGTKTGDGTCKCKDEYKGDDCSECQERFSYRNYTTETCHACDQACNGCTGPTNAHCKQCAAGFELIDDVCVDVDECAKGTAGCKNGTYCQNEPGAFRCMACMHDCAECTGPTEDKTCSSCREGYELTEEKTCQDIDECKNDPCERPNEICFNMPGSYYCNCFPGYRREGDDCVRTDHDEL